MSTRLFVGPRQMVDQLLNWQFLQKLCLTRVGVLQYHKLQYCARPWRGRGRVVRSWKVICGIRSLHGQSLDSVLPYLAFSLLLFIVPDKWGARDNRCWSLVTYDVEMLKKASSAPGAFKIAITSGSMYFFSSDGGWKSGKWKGLKNGRKNPVQKKWLGFVGELMEKPDNVFYTSLKVMEIIEEKRDLGA